MVEDAPKRLSSRRALPLGDGLVSVLRRASARYAEERLALGAEHADSGYVAVNEIGEPYSPDTLTRMWHKLAKAAGVRPIRLHDARHSCGTALYLCGGPLAVIAKWLGKTTSHPPVSNRAGDYHSCPGERWDQHYAHAVADTSYAPCGARRRKAAFAGQRADLRSVLGSHFHWVTGNARRQA